MEHHFDEINSRIDAATILSETLLKVVVLPVSLPLGAVKLRTSDALRPSRKDLRKGAGDTLAY